MGSSRISPSKSVGPGDCRHGEGVYTTTMVPSQGRSKIGANAYGSGQESGEYYVKFRMPAKEADRYDGHYIKQGPGPYRQAATSLPHQKTRPPSGAFDYSLGH